MISIIYSFIFGGTICLIAQIIYDNTKLSAGHITSLFVSLGAFLEFFNLSSINCLSFDSFSKSIPFFTNLITTSLPVSLSFASQVSPTVPL